MAYTPKDPALADHLAWLGYVQPEGLVVSAPALVDAQAIIDRALLGDLQRKFGEQVTSLRLSESDNAETQPGIENLQKFVTEFLGWPYELLVGVDPSRPLPESLYVSLHEFQETLHPSFAVKNPNAKEGASPWLLLVQSHPATVDLDKPVASSERHWHATPSKKFERLLRETGVPIGLLNNGTELRLIYAPPKENSGALTFPVGAMTEVSGRLILGAFQLLLGSWTLFNAPSAARLPALLQRSRDYQASVSEILAEQVLHALYELLRGFESADERAEGKLLRELAAKDPHDIYGGLVTVLLRLVFILFAEDRGLLPGSGLYVRHYAVRGLFERLRADAERYPDTMDHRFGAWAQLLALFRVIHGGCKHPDLAMPARAGHLFDPDRYPFLEGRASRSEPIGALPLVSDGTLHRILEKLCILEGERVSYRTLDVEEIGSVYQTIMGFGVETAAGTAIALKGKRKNGGVPASPVFSLEQLLAIPAKDRAKWLKENADTELTGEADKRLKTAATVDDLLAALEKRIDRHATPAPVAQGGLVLQPTDERRRSGSHYTPRSFTEPIVRKTLEPILKRLAEEASGEQRAASSSTQPLTTHENPIISGPRRLAAGYESRRSGLETDAHISQGGIIRDDQPVPTGGGLDSSQSRGGLGATQPEGISTLHPHRAGQPPGTGNPSTPLTASGSGLERTGETTLGASIHSGPPVDRAGTKSGQERAGDGEQIVSGQQRGASSEHTANRSPLTAHSSPLPDPLAAHRSPLTPPTPEAILSLKICDIAVGSAAFLVETCRQLADVLVRAWRVHGGRPALPPDETEELLAMRTIAQRCLYGVDRNPMAVDLAKLSLWLATLAKDHPFTFLDHAIRCGDSLVGLTRRQIETFTWKTESKQGQLWEAEVRKRTAAALRERQNLLGLGDDYGTPQLKREKLEKADELLDLVRFIGDAAVAAFFAADKDKAREAKRAELAERIADYLGKGDLKQRPTDEVKALRGGQFPVMPFHYEIEYPEVFDRERPGFDGLVGNPPFIGGRRIRGALGARYLDWLAAIHEQSSGNADLVAHFFRRGFGILRTDGCLGLIATNTIGQGDTRSTGLRWICTNGGTIYSARKRYKWPGQAAVVVSVVWLTKGQIAGPFELDERAVPTISAYLFHSGGHENPATLQPNTGKSFQGTIVLGMGFTFDDAEVEDGANPLAEMERVIAKSPRNAERIFPFIGGSEVNDSPTQSHHRYVINFFDFPLRRTDLGYLWSSATEEQQNECLRCGIVPVDYPNPVAADWPDLLEIVEQKVKPERTRKKADGAFTLRQPLPTRWWMFADKRPALYSALRSVKRALAVSQTSKYFSFAFLQSNQVCSHKTVVFPSESFHLFVMVQSRPHQDWADFFGSSLEDRPVYTPSDCFETFPFPAGFETNAALEVAGRKYYEFRAALMQDLWLGLTEIYNLFHSPDDEALARLEALYRKRAATPDWRTAESVPADRSPLTLYATPAAALAAVQRLRTLHAAMDTAVLTAYGWTDLLPKCTCEFLLDYEDEEDGEEGSGKGEGSGRKKKKPWRYRWPDEIRDEVLARLLKLNAERAEEERLAGAAAMASASAKPKKRSGKQSAGATAQQPLQSPPEPDLFSR